MRAGLSVQRAMALASDKMPEPTIALNKLKINGNSTYAPDPPYNQSALPFMQTLDETVYCHCGCICMQYVCVCASAASLAKEQHA